MNPNTKIVTISAENISDVPQVICFINPKHKSYYLKINWLKKRFEEGLKIKMLYVDGEKKPVGFVEYVPGEFAWRAVDARGYMFIHCIWTYGKKNQHKGLGAKLIKEVEKDAKDTKGIAVITSDTSFMTSKDIFIRNGFTVVEESGNEQLLVKQFQTAPLPKFTNWQSALKKYKGLNIVYSKQCPWVARSIEELQTILQDKKLNFKITELTTAQQAQNAPSVYGVFNLIHDGKLLADRYISTTRFKNIIKKEIIPR